MCATRRRVRDLGSGEAMYQLRRLTHSAPLFALEKQRAIRWQQLKAESDKLEQQASCMLLTTSTNAPMLLHDASHTTPHHTTHTHTQHCPIPFSFSPSDSSIYAHYLFEAFDTNMNGCLSFKVSDIPDLKKILVLRMDHSVFSMFILSNTLYSYHQLVITRLHIPPIHITIY